MKFVVQVLDTSRLDAIYGSVFPLFHPTNMVQPATDHYSTEQDALLIFIEQTSPSSTDKNMENRSMQCKRLRPIPDLENRMDYVIVSASHANIENKNTRPRQYVRRKK